MFLRELFEADSNEVAIIFGRFNPPHFGHKAAWETAAQFGNWYVGTNRSTEGPKDPLPFEVKLEAMKTIMPEIEGHIVPEQTWFTLAAWVYKEHGDNTILHIITDSEDAQVFYPAIKKQNGQQGPHGYYNFKDIVWTEAKRLSKATNLRQAIVDNDPEAFSKAAGVPADTKVAGAPFFELVKKYMLPYMEAAAAKEREKAEKERLKAEKERAKAEKAKAKQPQGMGEGSEPQFVAARYIDEFADGDHWYVKGTPEIIRQFVQLANSLEDEAVKGTEYEPGKGMMAKIHAELGDDSIPQWQIVKAQNLEGLKPIGSKVLQRLMTPDLSDGIQEFMSDFLWTLEEKGLALVHGDNEQGVAEDWNKVNRQDKTDGLSQKAVNAYRRENPGSKLKTAVTTKPSKLKPGSKDAKRRKSFCARMSGNKGPMKDEKGRPTPKAKALRRWNCEESINNKRKSLDSED